MLVDPSIYLYYPESTKATSFAMFIISLVGLFVNGLAYYVAHFKLKQRTASTWVMALIGIVDILVCLLIIILEIAKYASHFIVLRNPYYCQYSGMFIMFFAMTTVDSVGVLSLIRGLSIVKNIDLEPIYAYSMMGILVVFNAIMNIIGVHYKIMVWIPIQNFCMATPSPYILFSRVYSYILLAKFILMTVIIISSYSYITYFYTKIVSPLNSKSYSSEAFIGDTSALSYQRGIIAKLVGLMMMYLVCFTPMLITVAVSVFSQPIKKPSAYVLSAITMNFTVILNAAFVLLYQKEARTALIGILPNWLKKSKSRQTTVGLEHFDI